MSPGTGSKRKEPAGRTTRRRRPSAAASSAPPTAQVVEGGTLRSRITRLVTLATTPFTWDDVRRSWRARWRELRPRWRRATRTGKKKLARAHERGATLVGRAAFAAVGIGLVVTAPFLVLVRGAVWLYERHGFPVWLALAVAGAGTLLVLTLYGALLSRRLTGRARAGFVARWVAAPLVVGYCAYGLLYVSSVNTKNDAVRSVYTATHPLLRMALSTLILADRGAVITDLARTPDDYKRMGLPVNRESLHYRQADGWVHAVDLRTRPGLKSLLVQWYFEVMGFDTLREIGTHDHLHVSLPLPAGTTP